MQGEIGFLAASYWLRKWREVWEPMTKKQAKQNCSKQEFLSTTVEYCSARFGSQILLYGAIAKPFHLQVHFEAYNRRYGDDGIHETMEWDENEVSCIEKRQWRLRNEKWSSQL